LSKGKGKEEELEKNNDTIIKIIVPKAGIEPARGFPHSPLKTACLPVPPLRQK